MKEEKEECNLTIRVQFRVQPNANPSLRKKRQIHRIICPKLRRKRALRRKGAVHRREPYAGSNPHTPPLRKRGQTHRPNCPFLHKTPTNTTQDQPCGTQDHSDAIFRAAYPHLCVKRDKSGMKSVPFYARLLHAISCRNNSDGHFIQNFLCWAIWQTGE